MEAFEGVQTSDNSPSRQGWESVLGVGAKGKQAAPAPSFQVTTPIFMMQP